jgi:hypothetical protein
MKTYPPIPESAQRALNGTPGVPYCNASCRHFARVYGTTSFCTATTPRTETAWTGKCVCPARRHVESDPMLRLATVLGDLLDEWGRS